MADERVASTVIATWYYEQTTVEGGVYAQVRGRSSTERFRDTYRRCIATFFLSARRENPAAELVLFLNKPWDPGASRVAAEVDRLLTELGVERRIVEYTFAPPATWTRAWRNQFYVFDVLQSLADTTGPADRVLVLDSDIVWSGNRTEKMWAELDQTGYLLYEPDTLADINGLSRTDLQALAEAFRTGSDRQPAPDRARYYGGEFVALRGDVLRSVVELSGPFWAEALERHEAGLPTPLEEAHMLSLVYWKLGLHPASSDGYVRRIWTQPFRFRDVTPGDFDLPLWHVPAEKMYGLRRLYRRMTRDATLGTADPDTWSRRAATMVGIPANTPGKVALDVLFSVWYRFRNLVR